MDNPFFIDPTGGRDTSSALKGLGQSLVGSAQIYQQRKQDEAIQERMNAGKSALSDAGSDPAKIAKVMTDYPELQKLAESQFKFTNEATKPIVEETYARVLSDPANATQYLQQGIERVTAAGGTPENMMSDLESFQVDPESAFKQVELGVATVSPKLYEAYKASSSSKAPEYTNVQFDAQNRPYGINKATGQYEPIQGDFVRGTQGPSTVVKVGAGETEQQKVIGKAAGESYNELQKSSSVARKSNQTLSRLEKLGEKAFSGTGAGALKQVAKVLDNFGIETEGLTETEVYDALAGDLVLDQTNKLQGVLTDRDMAVVERTVPQLSQTEAGRKKLIGIMREVNKAAIDQAKYAAEYRKENNGYFDPAGFNEWMDQKGYRKDYLSKFSTEIPQQAPSVPSGLGGGGVSAMSDDELRRSLGL